MTRVLFVAPLPPPITGQSRACRALLDDLEADPDVEVVVIDLMKGEHRPGFTLAQARRVPGLVREVARGARAADAVYLNLAQSLAGNAKDLLLLAALGEARARTVVHLHGGGIAETVYGRSSLVRAANRRLLRDVRRAIVLGESLRPVFAGVVPDDRIAVVENFADDELFVDEAAIRERFAAAGPLRVLFLGTLFESKGWKVLVEAVARVDGVELDVAGASVTADDAPADRAFLDRPRVAFHGVVDGEARRALLAGAHLLALPTWYPYEGQPLSILEAFASGCAVLTTDHSGIRDVFSDPDHGAFVEPRSVDALAAALTRARDDRAAWTDRALAARRHAERFRRARHLAALRGVLLGG
ncbi:MAG: glycosyltransferase family 4 protein [Planctomycetota bacterium JB042]